MELSKELLKWYAQKRRDLPWRPVPGSRPGTWVDPYVALVSELMLQQTQVATVVPYFNRWMERFPTIGSLAAAEEQDVLHLWQGLGYYSRARNLLRAARWIANENGGEFPPLVEGLMELPGVGRYTAGAIASTAFGVCAPILDGNVARVLARIHAIHEPVQDPATRARLWELAGAVVPKKNPGDFNSALMELGATLCTPKNPKCAICPLRAKCRAFALGLQESIPPAKKPVKQTNALRWVFCIVSDERVLIEQRPANGRWGGLWQFVTIPLKRGMNPADAIKESTGIGLRSLKKLGTIRHQLSHMRYEFQAIAGTYKGRKAISPPRCWKRVSDLSDYPFSRPQRLIAEMLHAWILARKSK